MPGLTNDHPVVLCSATLDLLLQGAVLPRVVASPIEQPLEVDGIRAVLQDTPPEWLLDLLSGTRHRAPGEWLDELSSGSMADIVGAGAGVSQAAALALDRVGAASGVPAALVLGAPPDPDTPFLLEVADLIRRYGALQQAIYGPLAALIARARACILDMQQEDALPDSDDEDPGHDSPEEDPSDEALKAGSSDGDLAAPAGLWPPLRQCDLLLATLVAEQAAARERLLRTVLLGHAAPGGHPIWVCLARFLLRRLGDHTEAALVPVPDRQATAWALKLSGMLSYSMKCVCPPPYYSPPGIGYSACFSPPPSLPVHVSHRLMNTPVLFTAWPSWLSARWLAMRSALPWALPHRVSLHRYPWRTGWVAR